jgi:FkbM family methyltransferase
MVSRFGDGTWEITMEGLREIREHLGDLRPGDCFVDVGANDGSYTLLAARLVGREGIVLAFEPNPWVFRDLVRNLGLNDCSNVIALCMAVGGESDLVDFSFPVGHTGAGRQAVLADGPTWKAVVECIALESGLAKACRGRRVFVKVDVEGAELQALRGLRGIFETGNLRKAIVEIDERHLARYASKPDDVFALMSRYGLQPTVGTRTRHYDEVFVPSDE